MRKIALTLAIGLVASSVSFADVTLTVNGEGLIVLNADPAVEAAGLDFISPANALIPTATPPGAFQFMLSNKSSQITFANLGQTTTIGGGFISGAGYNGDTAAAVADLVTAGGSAWGDGATPSAFVAGGGAVVDPTTGGTDPIIPEPTTGLLALIGGLGLLGFRRRR